MTATIQNDVLTITIEEAGAELTSIQLNADKTEYLWQAEPSFWQRHAPILFPIVGRLVDNTYYVKGMPYELPQHGFARDMTFDIAQQSDTFITYKLTSNEATLQKYPFQFELYVTYTLENNSLHVQYEVKNRTDGDMYFSIGAHPGFRCPLLANEQYTDYYLEFSSPERLETYVLQGPYIREEKLVLAERAGSLPLSQQLFKNDAIILENMNHNEITIRSHKNEKFIRVSFDGFPYVGIWSESNGAPFVCIEPWYGIADEVGEAKELHRKKGIQVLGKDENFTCQYTITIG
ncbi:aldose 1-epimerase family protein [Bacillus sp. 165]|uniref:aldose 1-epimerase family protein n=1 Tax=Bacillus sp. 165 TaxID=1529117 RepID=UPI001ADA20C9|nr:aldose 1-epimerase family protein [Bacillus sp. 165]MBO9128181.1 aldose 1-epimerase family protein [Bacillus sp. 165]